MERSYSRKGSFIIITVVYMLAAAAGYLVFSNMRTVLWMRVLAADIAATLLVFVFSCVYHNASVYDPYWSVQPIAILIATAREFTLPAALLAFLILLWGVRLTLNWAYTFQGLDYQDWRYTDLQKKTGALYPLVNLFGIHMVPTLIVYSCIIPVLHVLDRTPAFRPLCLIGFLISLSGAVLQMTADLQMHRYRRHRETTFIETGLWRYSRHPNYLGEIMMWWGVSLFSIALLGFSWYLCIGAAANHLMFLFISIPMAEKRQGQKPGFEEYKARTHLLIPLRK